VQKQCIVCGVTFPVKPSHFDLRHCCSRSCQAIHLRSFTGSKNPNWRGGATKLTCLDCHNTYHVIPARAVISKYCSRLCQNRWQARQMRKRPKRRTPIKAILLIRKDIHRQYWSLRLFATRCRSCRRIINKTKTYCVCCKPYCGKLSWPCVICRGKIEAYPSQRNKKKTCNPECRKAYARCRQLGTASHRFVDGSTPVKTRVRNSAAMQQWRQAVFDRDDFTCTACGDRGGVLHAHHIVPFAHIFKRNRLRTVKGAMSCTALWDVNNGTTLCKQCHFRIPKPKANSVDELAADLLEAGY